MVVPPAVDDTCVSCEPGGRSLREAEACGLSEREAVGGSEGRAGKEGVRLPTLESPDDDDDDDVAIGDATALATAAARLRVTRPEGGTPLLSLLLRGRPAPLPPPWAFWEALGLPFALPVSPFPALFFPFDFFVGAVFLTTPWGFAALVAVVFFLGF